MKIIKEVGELIYQIRKEKGISQEKLADIIGTDQSYISKVEKNKISPTIQSVKNIAKALEKDFVYFFEDVE